MNESQSGSGRKLHRVIHASCAQLGTKSYSPVVGWHRGPCGTRATHKCADHGAACDLHSRYSPVAPTRLCDTCRLPMRRIAPVKP